MDINIIPAVTKEIPAILALVSLSFRIKKAKIAAIKGRSDAMHVAMSTFMNLKL